MDEKLRHLERQAASCDPEMQKRLEREQQRIRPPKKGKPSFLDCKHDIVQTFTECCQVCGYNIHISDKEYLDDLRKQVKRNGSIHNVISSYWKRSIIDRIRFLEKQLDIGP